MISSQILAVWKGPLIVWSSWVFPIFELWLERSRDFPQVLTLHNQYHTELFYSWSWLFYLSWQCLKNIVNWFFWRSWSRCCNQYWFAPFLTQFSRTIQKKFPEDYPHTDFSSSHRYCPSQFQRRRSCCFWVLQMIGTGHQNGSSYFLLPLYSSFFNYQYLLISILIIIHISMEESIVSSSGVK